MEHTFFMVTVTGIDGITIGLMLPTLKLNERVIQKKMETHAFNSLIMAENRSHKSHRVFNISNN